MTTGRKPRVMPVRRAGRREGIPNLTIGYVTNRPPGSTRASVRLSGQSSRAIRNVKAADGVEFRSGDQVLVANIADSQEWVIVARILDVSEAAGYLASGAASSQLHPPSGFTVFGAIGAVVANWQSWSGSTVCWQVQYNSSASESGASTLYTYGSYFFYHAASPATQYIRVRGIRYDVSTGSAHYSGWTEWAGDTSLATAESLEVNNNTIVATAGGNYSIIQSAVSANPDTTIITAPGDYGEDITLTESGTTLIGQAPTFQEYGGDVRVTGSGLENDPVLAALANCSISGYILEGVLTDSLASEPTFPIVECSEVSMVYFTDVTIKGDAGDTGRDLTGIKIHTGGLSRCSITVENEGSGYAAELLGGTVSLDNCLVTGDICATAASDLYLYSGSVTGDVTGMAGSALYLRGSPHISGTVSGWDSVVGEETKGAPLTVYKDTRANVEADHTDAGMIAYATDTGRQGYYDGAVGQWVWLSTGGGVSGGDAATVDGYSASGTPVANFLLALNSDAQFTSEVIPSEINALCYPPVWKFDIDEPKEFSTSFDDDFTSGSLDGKWTVVDGTLGAVDLFGVLAGGNGLYDLSTRSGQLLIQGRDNDEVLFRQDYTLPDGHSIILAVAASVNLAGSVSSDELIVGVSLNDNDTDFNAGNCAYMCYDAQAGGYQYQYVTSGSGEVGATEEDGPFTSSMVYLRISRVGTAYYGFFSIDGQMWAPFGSDDMSVVMDNVWIFVMGTAAMSGPIPIQAVNWIRQGSNEVDPW